MPITDTMAQPSLPRTLRARRTDPDAARFDPGFFEKSPLFWPIAAAASAFRHCEDWPPVEEYARAFRGAVPPVSFELAQPKPRRWRRSRGAKAKKESAAQAAGAAGAAETVDVRALYDGRISLTRQVPTRPRSWHDFLNALVWATFPAAKSALHARQYAAMSAHVPATATRLPNARTRELDALALLDEGGVIVLRDRRDGRESSLIFGHALYEGLVLGERAMIARAWRLDEPDEPEAATLGPCRLDSLDSVDRALARALAARDPSMPLVPEILPRVAVDSIRST